MSDAASSKIQRRMVIVAGMVFVAGTVLVAVARNHATRDAAGVGELPPTESPESEGGDVWRLVKVGLTTTDGRYFELVAGVLSAPLTPPANADNRGGLPPVEPAVEFSHSSHVGRLGIDCRHCHGTPTDTGKVAAATCMNCHHQVWTEPDLLTPLVADPSAKPRDRQRRFAVRRDPGKSPKELELTECDGSGRVLPGATVRRGLYDEGPAGLVVALPYGSVVDWFRPKGFTPTSPTSAGVAVLHLAK